MPPVDSVLSRVLRPATIVKKWLRLSSLQVFLTRRLQRQSPRLRCCVFVLLCGQKSIGSVGRHSQNRGLCSYSRLLLTRRGRRTLSCAATSLFAVLSCYCNRDSFWGLRLRCQPRGSAHIASTPHTTSSRSSSVAFSFLRACSLRPLILTRSL